MSDKPQTPSAQDTPDEPADNTPPDTPNASTPETSPGKTEGDSEATFTQADIDRIAARTRQETRDAERKKVLEDIGASSFDDLKALVTEYRKRKEDEMSELEKAQAEIEKARKKAEDAEKRVAEMQQERLAARRRDAFLKAVRASGGRDVEDLHILVEAKHRDDYLAVFDDEAKPDDGKMKSFIKQVQSDHPAYFGSAGGGSPSNADGQTPRGSGLTPDIQQAIRQKHGRL